MPIRLTAAELRKLAAAAPDGDWSQDPTAVGVSDRTNESTRRPAVRPKAGRPASTRDDAEAAMRRVMQLEATVERLVDRVEAAESRARAAEERAGLLDRRIDLLTQRAQSAIDELARRIRLLAGK